MKEEKFRFQASVCFQFPLKTPENQKLFDVFVGYEKEIFA